MMRNDHPNRQPRKVRGFWLIWPALAVLAFFLQRFLARSPVLVEQNFSRTIFRWIADPIASLTSAIPFSLMEVLIFLLAAAAIVLFVIWLVRLIRLPERLPRFGRLLRRLTWIASIIYLVFILLHGMNYARLPVATSFSLPVQERGLEDLQATATWLIGACNQLRASRQEDGEGVFQLEASAAETLREAADGYAKAAENYPLLKGPAVRPKSLLISRVMSYTGIAGIYFPFLVESNINADMPDYQIPAAALHEIAHTRGFAREDEAGFIAFLAGIAHPNADYAYTVLVDALIRCTNEIYGLDPKVYDQLARQIDTAIWRDLSAGSAYWKQFEGPVQQASTDINNAYLQANLQKDGVRSYGRMLDLVLAWYEIQSAAGTLDQAVTTLSLSSASAADNR